MRPKGTGASCACSSPEILDTAVFVQQSADKAEQEDSSIALGYFLLLRMSATRSVGQE